MKVVGKIQFDGHMLEVYDSLDEPYFRAAEVAKLIDYSTGNTASMLELIEKDEHLLTVMKVSGQRRQVSMITELGLYNVLSQSKKPLARKWRRVVHSNLILLRKQKEFTIADQFDEWNALLEDLYIDPESGELMQIVTVQGGDVDVIPYVEDKERV